MALWLGGESGGGAGEGLGRGSVGQEEVWLGGDSADYGKLVHTPENPLTFISRALLGGSSARRGGE